MRILYDSKLLRYKTPFGVLLPEQVCTMHIAIPRSCQTVRVQLCLRRDDTGTEQWIDFSLCGGSADYEEFEGRFSLTEAGLYFYFFRIQTKNECFSLFKQGDDTNMEAGDLWQLSCIPASFQTPSFARGAVMYQIFPDRFARAGQCDLTGKLTPYTIHDSPWDLPEYRPDDAGEIQNNDFFGGNFPGIQEKLPYLHDLGVTVLYLNPICKAYSNHRYDTCDYRTPDPMLGTQAQFSQLCDAAHRLGMRIILDGVFSHTGSDSIYFDCRGRFGGGALEGESSPYYSWYEFQRFPEQYTSWWGIRTLPCVRELDPGFLQYVIEAEDSVIAHWLRLGADGFRLDVADELPDEFIQRLRRRMHQVKPDSLLIGEVWEDASNKIAYDVRRRYFTAGELDAVMNYPWRTAILRYCRGQDDGRALRDTVMTLAENYPPQALACSMNILGTHDTPRILTALVDEFEGSREQQAHRRLSPEQRDEALRRLRLASFLQFTLPGTPCIYYGDEAGMEGHADPFNRCFFPWGREDAALQAHYRALARLKHSDPAIRLGDITDFTAGGGRISFLRRREGHCAAVLCNQSDTCWALPYAGQVLFSAGLEDGGLQPGGFCVLDNPNKQ